MDVSGKVYDSDVMDDEKKEFSLLHVTPEQDLNNATTSSDAVTNPNTLVCLCF